MFFFCFDFVTVTIYLTQYLEIYSTDFHQKIFVPRIPGSVTCLLAFILLYFLCLWLSGVQDDRHPGGIHGPVFQFNAATF